MFRKRDWRLGAGWIRTALIACCIVGAGTAARAAGPVVQTEDGPVEGILTNRVAEFFGIPYAAPPVGDLRWRPPQDPKPWTKPLSATAYGPRCAQVTTLGVFAGPANNNEDCLYLNVFTPSWNKYSNLAVVVWIHGGGNFDGESNDYDGSKLALDGKTVVVTINYRLNLMGFLAAKSLDSEGHLFGNYGLLDQQKALQWVRRNIAAFGGDPTNVTLGGQSAGAVDTGLNMLSPLATGLFERGICQSFCAAGTLKTAAAAEAVGEQFATAAGCGSKTGTAQAQCLRALPASKVEQLAGTASATSPFVIGPMLDGTVLPIQPATAWAEGKFTHMPLINGNVEDEEDFGLAITEYFAKPQAPATAADYENFVKTTYAPPAYPAGTAERVLSRYPLRAFSTPQVAWDRVGTDPGLCQQMHLNRVLASQIPVYAYTFYDQTPPFYFPKLPGFFSLAYHTADIQFIFPLYHGGQGIAHPLIGDQERLSNELVLAWSRFAWFGNPDGFGNSPWPQFTTARNTPTIYVENVPVSSTQSNTQFNVFHNCVLWASITSQ